jgi:hypothetical protein
VSDPEREGEPEGEPEEVEETFAATPFDGPWVMPAVLLGFAAWFGYDGWLNDDPDMARWWWFNQGGAVLFGLSALVLGLRALRARDRDDSS